MTAYRQPRRRRKPRPRQLTLDDARRPTGRGGWRPRAGRPRRGRTRVAHGRRERFEPRIPQHVTLRVLAGLRPLRRLHLYRTIQRCILAAHKPHFRTIHFHLLDNHLHLVVEAHGAVGLARGIQGLAVRLARRLNRQLGRRGTFFAERYHTRALRSPRQVRNALRYVLLNDHHHAARWGDVLPSWPSYYSSGATFDGWRHPLQPRAHWQREHLAAAPATMPATVWLLTTGWRRHGPIWFDDPPS
jgi:hypothetical protein